MFIKSKISQSIFLQKAPIKVFNNKESSFKLRTPSTVRESTPFLFLIKPAEWARILTIRTLFESCSLANLYIPASIKSSDIPREYNSFTILTGKFPLAVSFNSFFFFNNFHKSLNLPKNWNHCIFFRRKFI